MIIDTLTHVWESPDQLGRVAELSSRRDPRGDWLTNANPGHHLERLDPVDVALVFGFRSLQLGAHIPNKLVADYAGRHPGRLIAIAGIDPTAEDALEEFDLCMGELGMGGAAISPSAQGFHPMDTQAIQLYERISEMRVPLVVYQGPAAASQSRLEFAEPVLLDEVLREFPDMRVVLGGLGSPWIQQGLTLMTKHPNLSANLRGLIRGRWQTYNALMSAQEFGVIDRLLFASDFPYTTPARCIEMLYSLHQIVQGTNLPSIPREQLRGIVERDALSMLGLDIGDHARREPRLPFEDDQHEDDEDIDLQADPGDEDADQPSDGEGEEKSSQPVAPTEGNN